MDLATLLGITLGAGLLLGSIILGGEVNLFWNPSGLMIVLGGTIAALFVNFPLKNVLGVLPLVRVAFTQGSRSPKAVIDTLVDFAESSRREGLLALEDKAQELDEEFLQKGIQLVVDGTEPELVRSILEIELAFLEQRHKTGQKVFEQMGAIAPAFGMIGTLIGLIQMLQELDDPDQVGSGMAVALLTTLYGAVAANLVFLPIAGKLAVKSDEEIVIREIMIEGILSIQAGENPRIVEEKLKAFLAPDQRNRLETEAEGERVLSNA